MSTPEDVAKNLPALRQAFESFKGLLHEGSMNAAASKIFGNAVLWGEELKEIYAAEDREALAARDPLTRFFVCRFRGMPVPADLSDAPPEAVFLMAFTSFPYLDVLLDEMTLGEHVGFDEDGNWIMRRLLAGEDDGSLLRAEKAPIGWHFDLMPIYHAKAAALLAFLEQEFAGDFDAFLWRYIADHDLAFDTEQAWAPLSSSQAAE